MSKEKHWDTIYQIKKPTDVSWFQPHLQTSLALIERANLVPDARIIDVGGGASTLVDDLLERGFRNITVLDISGVVLERVKKRLESRAGFVS
mgnify:CR=1 FL=1|jgi:ubiquinone/menaquinone biosynthesis C-methylase UbiE